MQLQLWQPPCSFCVGIGELEATDMFCGAGGSSVGLEGVSCPMCGRSLIRVTQAINHWPLAVEAHNSNFPNADHDVHDVEVIPASRFRRTDVLWASPDCTHHAYCRGPKDSTPEANRSRATFNDVVRFTAHHRYDAVMVENVVEARLWCDSRAHGPKCSCGSSFNEWFVAMESLGYDGRIVYFNSQFALPTPQSRDRMYVVFTRCGIPAPNLDFRPIAWCSSCNEVVHAIQTWKPVSSKKGTRAQPGMFEWGRYGTQYLYRCPGCGEPAAPAVCGATHAIDWSLETPLIGAREKGLAPKTRQRILHGVHRLGTLDPVTVQVGGNLFERRPGVRVWSVNDPMRTVVGTSQLALVTRYGGQQPSPRDVDEPFHTITAHDREIGLVVPNMTHCVGAGVDEPLGAVTTGNRHMLVQVNRGSADETRMSQIAEPMRTVAGHGEWGIVSMRNHGGVSSPDEPVPTVTGGGYHHGMLVYNGNPGYVDDTRVPAGTIKGRDSQALLVPYYGTGVARPIAMPAGTLTSKDRQALLTMSDVDVDGMGFRMLQWHELLRAQHMHEHRDGRPYELTAKRRDQRTGRMKELSNEQRVKMIGNAVSSPVATMLGTAVAEALSGKDLSGVQTWRAPKPRQLPLPLREYAA